MTYADILRNKVFSYPPKVRKEIDTLFVTYDFGAQKVLSCIKQSYPDIKHVSIGTLEKYKIWRKANPEVFTDYSTNVPLPPKEEPKPEAKDTKVVEFNNVHDETIKRIIDEENPTGQPKFTIVSTPLLNTESNKDTLEGLKLRLQDRILLLEQEQMAKFDKQTESILQKYYDDLRNLIHSDVKLANDLKDSDKISVADVKLSISKLFSCLRTVVEKMLPERKEEFITELTAILKAYSEDTLLSQQEVKND